MNHEYIDLYTTAFWLLVLAALVVLTPITNSIYRKWIWAAINVWFLYQLMGTKSVVVVVGALFVWGLLLVMAQGRARAWCFALGVVGSLALFVLHKLPDVSDAVGLIRLNPIMTIIGFSYIVVNNKRVTI